MGTDHTGIIKACKIPDSPLYRHAFLFSRQKKPCFCKPDQYNRRFLEPSPGKTCIDLHNLFPCMLPGVANTYRYRKAILQACYISCLHCKAGIAQAISKRIYHFFFGTGNGFKVAVSYIDIIGILHIILRLPEAGRRRIGIKVDSKSIRQMTRRSGLPCQKPGRSPSTFRTALPWSPLRPSTAPLRRCRSAAPASPRHLLGAPSALLQYFNDTSSVVLQCCTEEVSLKYR